MLVGLFFFSFRVLPIGSSTRSAASACSWYTLAHDSTCFKCPEDEADRIAAKVVTVFFSFLWRPLILMTALDRDVLSWNSTKQEGYLGALFTLYLMANCLETKTKYSRKSTLFVLFFFSFSFSLMVSRRTREDHHHHERRESHDEQKDDWQLAYVILLSPRFDEKFIRFNPLFYVLISEGKRKYKWHRRISTQRLVHVFFS